MDVEIRPLTPDLWPALEGLFAEGGDPKWCWCMYWRTRAADFGRSKPAGNREALARLVASGPPPGLLALDAGGRAVGWVSLGPRAGFARLARSRSRRQVDEVPAWSVVCFVVARRARRQGVASRLLAAAIVHARAAGAVALEGYPVDTTIGRPTASALYSGTLSTFLRAGFRVAADVTSPQATVRRAIVRLDLSDERVAADRPGPATG